MEVPVFRGALRGRVCRRCRRGGFMNVALFRCGGFKEYPLHEGVTIPGLYTKILIVGHHARVFPGDLKRDRTLCSPRLLSKRWM